MATGSMAAFSFERTAARPAAAQQDKKENGGTEFSGCPAFQIKVKRHDVKQTGERGHPLDNIGYGSYPDRTDRPEKGRQQGSRIGRRLEFIPQQRQLQSIENKQKQKDRRQIMNDKIDDVITKNICPVEIIVNGKTEVRQGPGRPFLSQSVNAFFNIIPGKIINLDVGIADNIEIIIKMPIAVKTVGINNQQENKQGNTGKGILRISAQVPFDRQGKAVFRRNHDIISLSFPDCCRAK